MVIRVNERVDHVQTFYRDCLLGCVDAAELQEQFGDNVSFIGKMTEVGQTDDGGYLYGFEMDRITRGFRDSSCHVITDRDKFGHVIMLRALDSDYGLADYDIVYRDSVQSYLYKVRVGA